MSLRLVRKTNSRRAIGVIAGVPVYGISGADPEGDETQPDEDTGDSGDSESDETGKPDAKPEDKGHVVSKEEYDKIVERMKAADRSASEALKKVKEYEDKDKSETERLASQVETLTATNESLTAENKALKFDNAFALQSKHSWQDPEIVLSLVRKHSDVTIDDDGTVKGLEKALDAIAKAKPFLLKDRDNEEEEGLPPTASASGTGTGSGKRTEQNKLDEDRLRKKYPALNL